MKKSVFVLLVNILLIVPCVSSTEIAVPISKGTSAPFDGILIPPDIMKTYLALDLTREKLDYELRTTKELLRTQDRLYSNPYIWRAELNRWAGFIVGLVVGHYLLK